MRRNNPLWLCLGLFLFAASFAAQAANPSAGSPVGSARVIVEQVSAQAATDAARRLAVADEVRFQELISTARKSAAALRLIDGTELAMGENAELRLDDFVLSDGLDANLTLRVSRGALRFVTGSMPKPAYRINTPTASLTVRGTVFNLAVGDDGASYLAVDSGAVRVTTAGGQSVDVAAGQSIGIDATGIAGLPQPTPAIPAGALPGMIAEMDLDLAQHLAGLGAAQIPDLEVLGPSRDLAQGLAGGALKDRPGFNGGNHPDRAKDGRGDKGGKGKQ